MSTNKGEDIEQNPKAGNLGGVRKAGGVEGQRKEVNVADYANAAALARFLEDLDFPADKKKIIHVVQLKEEMNISKTKKEELLNALYKNLDKTKQYQNVSEVAGAAEFVK